jgi:hypothetical protein
MAYTILLNKIKIGSKAPKAIYKGGTEVKCVYKGSTLVYDTQKSSTLTRRFYFSYPSNYLNRDGGSYSCSITKGYDTTATGHSGATYNRGWTTAGGTPTFTKSSGASWLTLNSTTGAISWQANNAQSKYATITGKCTIEGTELTATQNVENLGDPYTLKIYHYCHDHRYRSLGGYFFSSNSYYNYSQTVPGIYYPIRDYGAIDTYYGLSGNYPTFTLVDDWGSQVAQPYYSQTIYVWTFIRDNEWATPSFHLRGSIYWTIGSMNNYTFNLNITQ